MKHNLFISLLLCLPTIALIGSSASAFDKPFFPWLWHDQFKPTLQAAIERDQAFIFAGGVGLTILAHQQDVFMRERYGAGQLMDASVAGWGSFLGSGAPGISIALAQLYFDQDNGLRHARALALTSLTAVTTALTVNRERPNRSPYSFPSGHTSSSFATATSLAYSYGPWVGIPAYGVATFIGASRISDDAHWFSDTVAGAALGIFWGRASALATKPSEKSPGATNVVSRLKEVTPVLMPDGFMLNFSTAWN